MIDRRSGLTLALLLLASLAQATEPYFSQQLPLLPVLSRATVVNELQASDALRQYPQSSIRRISNQVRTEQQVSVSGELIVRTYRLQSGLSSAQAFAAARQTLQAQGAQLLFWCEGRDCGSSSLWANSVFDNSRLYGPEDQQAYLLVRLAAPASDSLLALYAITRGNRRAYLHVEQLSASRPLGNLLPTPSTLLLELMTDGELQLPELPVQPEPPWIQLLTRTLELDRSLMVVISGAPAAGWRAALIEQGVRPSRLQLGDDQGAKLQLELRH